MGANHHSQESLRSHLIGTSSILARWQCSDAICSAGLCHSIYGTESFLKVSAALDNREYMKKLIGFEAENLAYLFGAHKKESLWKNLKISTDFSIHNRFTDRRYVISRNELASLITITLANWLEQRPRARIKDQYVRLTEFKSSEEFLPPVAYQEFLCTYNLN